MITRTRLDNTKRKEKKEKQKKKKAQAAAAAIEGCIKEKEKKKGRTPKITKIIFSGNYVIALLYTKSKKEK